MTLPSSVETSPIMSGETTFLDGQVIPVMLQLDDRLLLAELAAKNKNNERHVSEKTELSFVNAELAAIVQESYTADELAALEALLGEKGTLDIPITSGFTVMVDGEPKAVSIVAATEVDDNSPNHGDMSSMLYLRDHVQASSALMELHLQNPNAYAREGKTGHTLLLSALHLMSTPSQLSRFADVIARGNEVGQEDWPHISLRFDDMEGNEENGWRNKQDTFQMLAYQTLDAVERGFLDGIDLSDSHKRFLGSIVPLLKSVGFPKYENSGSWEEIAANRTSVMAIETALLHKMKRLVEKDDTFSFLRDEFDRVSASQGDFTETITSMIQDGLEEVGRRLPYESPDYDETSVKFREADAALTYVLMYDLPQLLADATIPIGKEGTVMSPQGIENLVLSQLSTLIDPATNGMCRYESDSYQRVNFHTNEVQWKIGAIKRHVSQSSMRIGGEVDLDKKQALRGEHTPQGKLARWTHPIGQLSAWAAKRSLQETEPEIAEQYQNLSTLFLNRSLSTVTGENMWNATLDEDGKYGIREVAAYRLPECYVTYEVEAVGQFAVPSPHTPLNWSSAMLKQAIGLLKERQKTNRPRIQ